MKIDAKNVEDYLSKCPEERQESLKKLRNTILDNLPQGFTEELNYGMPGYVIPHSIYPAGYHCDPKLPLPFMGFASQKNFIAFYHSGIYADEQLLNWFTEEYRKTEKYKLDMGKSCIRFKKPEQIPFELIGKLVKKMSPEQYISIYENRFKN
ncbi:MAG: DUF1801 domain-containing protein [Brumimicrobium sp.]|nr:DUF1801 domain-containing protein [Brumimicrobium sp.]